MAKLDTQQVVVTSNFIIDKLNEMDAATKQLDAKARAYADAQSDSIMSGISDLLQEIQVLLADTRKKTEEYSAAKREGAIAISQVETDITKLIKKI